MGFLLVLIGVGAALAVRALTHTLQTFSDGIRAVAAGRFDQRLPVRGNDEFSQFGAVFNDMSSQLEQRIDELDSERRRVQEFGQRFGAALAATHDVAGLLEIVVDSAVQLARADGARLLVADEGTDVLVEQLRRGDLGRRGGPARRAGALRRGHRGPRPADAPGRDRRRARAAAGRAARGRGARARPAHAGRQSRSAVRARRRRARRLAGRPGRRRDRERPPAPADPEAGQDRPADAAAQPPRVRGAARARGRARAALRHARRARRARPRRLQADQRPLRASGRRRRAQGRRRARSGSARARSTSRRAGAARSSP